MRTRGAEERRTAARTVWRNITAHRRRSSLALRRKVLRIAGSVVVAGADASGSGVRAEVGPGATGCSYGARCPRTWIPSSCAASRSSGTSGLTPPAVRTSLTQWTGGCHLAACGESPSCADAARSAAGEGCGEGPPSPRKRGERIAPAIRAATLWGKRPASARTTGVPIASRTDSHAGRFIHRLPRAQIDRGGSRSAGARGPTGRGGTPNWCRGRADRRGGGSVPQRSVMPCHGGGRCGAGRDPGDFDPRRGAP